MISSINYAPMYLNEQFFRQKYLEEKLSTSQISRLTFSARSTVAKHLKRAGVRVRPYHEAIEDRPEQVPFGKRIKDGRLVHCKSELRLIQKMRDLRAKGFSYWRIAEHLNDWGVRTKNPSSRWHPTTVMKLIKRHIEIVHPQ